MVKLKVKSNYRNDPKGFGWVAGSEISVEPDVAHFLRVDAPGVFEVVTEPKNDHGLTDVSGIGEKYANALANAGIGSLIALINADADELADELEVAAGTVERWQKSARSLLSKPRAKTG